MPQFGQLRLPSAPMSPNKIKIDLKALEQKVTMYLLSQKKHEAHQEDIGEQNARVDGSPTKGTDGRHVPRDLNTGLKKLDITSKQGYNSSASCSTSDSEEEVSGDDREPDTERGEFEGFPKLPFELRLKVMRDSFGEANADDAPRVVEILYFAIPEKPGADGWAWHKSNHRHKVFSPSPDFHQVNTEFRDEALKTWSVRIDTRDGDVYTRLDPEKTILYISHTDIYCEDGYKQTFNQFMDGYSDMLTPAICDKIKHLAFDYGTWVCHKQDIFPLSKFTSLETFSFVVHDAGCSPDYWDPETEPCDLSFKDVNVDDLEIVRYASDFQKKIDHLIDQCTKYKEKNPEYKVPEVKTTVLYRDGDACCNSVESVADGQVDVLAPDSPNYGPFGPQNQ